MNTFLKNEKGMILIWFYVLIAVLVIMGGSLYALSFQESMLTTIDQARDKAFYLAEAGLDQKLHDLKAGNTSNISSTSLGDGTYSVTYDATTKRISSTGTVNGVSKTVVSVVAKTIPPGVKGALTSQGDISFSGNITVDGRDHDSSGNLTGASGTYGASSGGTVSQGGSSDIGGNGTYGASSGGTVSQGGSSDIGGNGVAPASPANPATIEQNQTDNSWTTPETLLGVASGSLDQYKTSSTPTFPMSGIVYYTGSQIIAPDFGTSSNPSTGILILHNVNADALLKNAHGTFKGLIIADNVVHINGSADIIGGVIAKTSTQTTGDGSATVAFSSSILTNLPAGNYTIVSWEDTQNTAYTYS